MQVLSRRHPAVPNVGVNTPGKILPGGRLVSFDGCVVQRSHLNEHFRVVREFFEWADLEEVVEAGFVYLVPRTRDLRLLSYVFERNRVFLQAPEEWSAREWVQFSYPEELPKGLDPGFVHEAVSRGLAIIQTRGVPHWI